MPSVSCGGRLKSMTRPIVFCSSRSIPLIAAPAPPSAPAPPIPPAVSVLRNGMIMTKLNASNAAKPSVANVAHASSEPYGRR